MCNWFSCPPPKAFTHLACSPFPLLTSKIELWELQRFLWTQYGSRLSDEFFDHITNCRQHCDPIDGALSPTAFLDFSVQLLSSSSTARGLATCKSKLWQMVQAGIRVAGGGESKSVEEEEDNHSEVLISL